MGKGTGQSRHGDRTSNEASTFFLATWQHGEIVTPGPVPVIIESYRCPAL